MRSRQNALVKRFRDIARAGRLGDDVLLDGPHLVGEALASSVDVQVVAIAASAAEGRHVRLARGCAAAGVRVITVPDALLEALSPVRQTTGVVAIAQMRPATIESALRHPPQLVLVLDGVQDPGNVGAIIRAAEGCGATAVITGPGTADPLGWKALRGSMGSTFRLPVAGAVSLASALDAARSAGLRIFSTVPRGGTPLSRADLSQPAAIVLGGEGAGVQADTRTRADEELTIPMQPAVESLNVAIAAALVVYEASRQRLHVAV